MTQHNDSLRDTLKNRIKTVVPITIARQPHITALTDDTPESAQPAFIAGKSSRPDAHRKLKHQPLCKQGGFVLNGQDGAELDLLTTHGGLNALRIFSQMGSVKPLYLNQEFFDSL